MTAPSISPQTDVAPLTGVERVAVMLLALDKPRASHLLKQFDADDLRQITQSAANLRPISAQDLSMMVDEFADRFSDGMKFLGTAEEVENLMAEVMSEDQLAGIVYGQPNVSVWERIEGVAAKQLTGLLEKEHPQVAAFVLSQIDPEQVVEIVSGFSDDLRRQTIRRMMNVGNLTEDVSVAIETALVESINALGGDSSESYMQSHLAEIFGKLDKPQAEELLSELASLRPEDAKAIKRMMFSFDDLVFLDTKSLATIFDRVPIEQVILALQGVDPEIGKIVMASLSARGRRMVEAELQSGTETSEKDCLEARQAIASTVLDLVKKGEISAPDLSRDDPSESE